MKLQEKIAALTEEEQEKLAKARNGQELLTAISEVGIELTDDDKAVIAKISAPKEGSRELTDEEVSEANGGLTLGDYCPRNIVYVRFMLLDAWVVSMCMGCSFFSVKEKTDTGRYYNMRFHCAYYDVNSCLEPWEKSAIDQYGL